MASSQDTEITLGTGKLLFLFFGLVAVCAVFFALGYSLGRKSEPAITTASAAVNPEPASAKKNGTASTPAPPMTFYKNVEQKEASPELTVPADKKNDTAPATATPTPAPAATGVDPSTTIPNSAYFVQVAAVSKQDDADALVDALKKKEYPAFVAANSSTDKLFRVQLGPFGDIKDAEAMRTKLVGDGYSPIVKK
jgi:DedD protein